MAEQVEECCFHRVPMLTTRAFSGDMGDRVVDFVTQHYQAQPYTATYTIYKYIIIIYAEEKNTWNIEKSAKNL